MIFNCEIDDCLFNSLNKNDFADHLKSIHKMSLKSYAESQLGKKDLFTGEPILFKSFEQYLLTDFVKKQNMISWLKNQEKVFAKKFIVQKIKKYSELKNLEFFPACSDFRTISYLPSLKTISYFYNDLNCFINEIGLKARFDYNLREIKLNNIYNERKIIADTREQKPLSFAAAETELKKLDFGDYSVDRVLAVERKSLNDLISTLSSGFERFSKEIKRSVDSNGYIVVVVDCDINTYLSFNYSSRISRYTKISPEFIFHRMRDLSKTFAENLQFCFSGGRKESADLIKMILSNKREDICRIDIQYLIDKKYINL